VADSTYERITNKLQKNHAMAEKDAFGDRCDHHREIYVEFHCAGWHFSG